MAEQTQTNKQSKQQTKNQQSTPKKHEYIPFRDMKLEDIKSLPTVQVKLERVKNQYGIRIMLTINFHNMFKKEIRSPRIIDERKYNLILLNRPDLNHDDNVHVFSLPVRFFERHDDEGNIKYRRFEIMFTRQVVISDFFDFVDDDLIGTLEKRDELKFDFKEDKDSSDEFSIAKQDIDYVHFQ